MYNVFYVSLLELDNNRKRQAKEIFIQIEFYAGNIEKNECEVIWDSAIYKEKLELGQLTKFHYLVL